MGGTANHSYNSAGALRGMLSLGEGSGETAMASSPCMGPRLPSCPSASGVQATWEEHRCLQEGSSRYKGRGFKNRRALVGRRKGQGTAFPPLFQTIVTTPCRASWGVGREEFQSRMHAGCLQQTGVDSVTRWCAPGLRVTPWRQPWPGTPGWWTYLNMRLKGVKTRVL